MPAVVYPADAAPDAEAEEQGLPLEVIEQRAVRAAAEDVAANYEMDVNYAAQRIANPVAHYGD